MPLTVDDIAPATETWVALAPCRGADALFYPPLRGESATARKRREDQAKEICSRCPVQADCLQYSLRARQRLGIWGGLNEKERRLQTRATIVSVDTP